MARADSTIRVNIIGDAKSLQKAAATSEGAVGGLNKKIIAAGAAIAGAFAVESLVDFGNTAVKEADRVGDAAGRIESQLGDLAKPLTDAADGFARLGASEGDMLELEAKIIDVGTALGITDDELAAVADDAAITASALALITDTDADTWMDQLGKAASGSERAMRALGVGVTEAEVEARALADTGKDTADALTDSELAAARLALILEELQPRIADVTTGTADLEQRQAELQARMETLTGKIGQHLEGPLNDLLGWVLAGIDGWEMLAGRLDAADVSFDNVTLGIRAMIAPITLVIDLVNELIRALNSIPNIDLTGGGTSIRPPSTNRGPFGGQTSGGGNVTVQVQGGSPEVIEQSVRRALQIASGHGPLE